MNARGGTRPLLLGALGAVGVLDLQRRQLDDLVLAGEDPAHPLLQLSPAQGTEEADAPDTQPNESLN